MDEKNYLAEYINWRLTGVSNYEINYLIYLHFYFRSRERLNVKLFFEDFFVEIIDEKSLLLEDCDYDDLPDFGYYENKIKEEDNLPAKIVISEQENIENDLIIGLANSENLAYKDLYYSEYKKIEDFVTCNSGTKTEAQDVFQDGVMVLLEKIKTPGFNFTCRVGTYLYSCCKNIWLKQLQKNKRKIGEDFYEVYDCIEVDVFEEPEDYYEKLNEILSNLSESCLEIIKAFYYELKSWETIAQELGYTSANSAKNQKYKCLKRIVV